MGNTKHDSVNIIFLLFEFLALRRLLNDPHKVQDANLPNQLNRLSQCLF